MLGDESGLKDPSLVENVYEHCLEMGGYDESRLADRLASHPRDIRWAHETLVGLGLLEEGDDGRLYPVSPETAESNVVRSRLRILDGEREDLIHRRDRIRSFLPVHRNHFTRRLSSASGVLNLDDPRRIRDLIHVASRTCEREVLTLQPGGGRPPETISQARENDLALVRRGVRVRVLYQHSSGAHLATRAYVNDLVAAGGEVRTSSELFDRMIVFDDDLVLLSHARGEDGPPGASVLTDAHVVAFFRRMYERIWENAVPFQDLERTSPPRAQDGPSPMHRAVCALLDRGHTDEVVGKKLGMSVRTVRRYVSEVAEMLDSSSRFQLGAEAVRRGIVPE
ncbi:DUF6879 family protein [Nocardiopsis sp. CC223A]|uniref:DUF6879 family protein n=1 Tax=Nocardiopsis sp. CC223A TaxID=3044051 RepID=UPI00278BCE39|nr:DUF6879 family protein [Nocardiopsis sp. CC223A]